MAICMYLGISKRFVGNYYAQRPFRALYGTQPSRSPNANVPTRSPRPGWTIPHILREGFAIDLMIEVKLAAIRRLGSSQSSVRKWRRRRRPARAVNKVRKVFKLSSIDTEAIDARIIINPNDGASKVGGYDGSLVGRHVVVEDGVRCGVEIGKTLRRLISMRQDRTKTFRALPREYSPSLYCTLPMRDWLLFESKLSAMMSTKSVLFSEVLMPALVKGALYVSRLLSNWAWKLALASCQSK